MLSTFANNLVLFWALRGNVFGIIRKRKIRDTTNKPKQGKESNIKDVALFLGSDNCEASTSETNKTIDRSEIPSLEAAGMYYRTSSSAKYSMPDLIKVCLLLTLTKEVHKGWFCKWLYDNSKTKRPYTSKIFYSHFNKLFKRRVAARPRFAKKLSLEALKADILEL